MSTMHDLDKTHAMGNSTKAWSKTYIVLSVLVLLGSVLGQCNKKQTEKEAIPYPVSETNKNQLTNHKPIIQQNT